MAILEGQLTASGIKAAVLASRFNQFVSDRLISGARDILLRHGAKEADLDVVHVPGAFELPLGAKRLASSGKYDVIVAVGVVVRGSTPHFDYLCAAVFQGLSRVALDSGVPVAAGVITADTMEQAIDRAGGKAGNKGAEAAATAIEMANLLKQL